MNKVPDETVDCLMFYNKTCFKKVQYQAIFGFRSDNRVKCQPRPLHSQLNLQILLGSYHGPYILNWIYRFYFEGFYDIIAIIAGCIQTILYCDFFYLYITKVLKGKKLQLPA